MHPCSFSQTSEKARSWKHVRVRRNWQRLVFVRWFVWDEEAFSAITLEPLSLAGCPVFNLEKTAWKARFDCLSWPHLEAVTRQTEPRWHGDAVMQIRPLKKHLASLSAGFHQRWKQCQWVLSMRQLFSPELLHSKQDVHLGAVACVCTYIRNSKISAEHWTTNSSSWIPLLKASKSDYK